MNPPPPPSPSAFEERPAPPPPPAPEPSSPSYGADKNGPSPTKRVHLGRDVPPDYIRHMVDVEGRKFDLYVLAVLLHNPLFFDQVVHLLCIDPCVKQSRFPTNERWDDFQTAEVNALYACIRKHRLANPHGGILTRGLAETMLGQLATGLYAPLSAEENGGFGKGEFTVVVAPTCSPSRYMDSSSQRPSR